MAWVNKKTSFKTSPLPGRGPWRILAECPALMHNSQRASTTGPLESRCICPRGLYMAQRRKEGRETSRMRHIEQERAKDRERRRTVPEYVLNVGGKSAPDLTGARCRTERGRLLLDEAFKSNDQRTPGALDVARSVCDSCPVRLPCGEWALRDEKPAGSWGGMYGGMTASQRRVEKTAREQLAGMPA